MAASSTCEVQMKAIILKGLPGSGKSTIAQTKEAEGFTVISRDRMRRSFDVDPQTAQTLDQRIEAVVRSMNRAAILEAGRQRLNVVIDECHLSKKSLDFTVKLLKSAGYDTVVVITVDEEPMVCYERRVCHGFNEKVFGSMLKIWEAMEEVGK